jgi:hypothetical protein
MLFEATLDLSKYAYFIRKLIWFNIKVRNVITFSNLLPKFNMR